MALKDTRINYRHTELGEKTVIFDINSLNALLTTIREHEVVKVDGEIPNGEDLKPGSTTFKPLKYQIDSDNTDSGNIDSGNIDSGNTDSDQLQYIEIKKIYKLPTDSSSTYIAPSNYTGRVFYSYYPEASELGEKDLIMIYDDNGKVIELKEVQSSGGYNTLIGIGNSDNISYYMSQLLTIGLDPNPLADSLDENYNYIFTTPIELSKYNIRKNDIICDYDDEGNQKYYKIIGILEGEYYREEISEEEVDSLLSVVSTTSSNSDNYLAKTATISYIPNTLKISNDENRPGYLKFTNYDGTAYVKVGSPTEYFNYDIIDSNGNIEEKRSEDKYQPYGTLKLNQNGVDMAVFIKGFENSDSNYLNISAGTKLSINDTTEATRIISSYTDPATGYCSDSGENAILGGSITTLGGIAANKSIKGYKVFGAVFNDYAEYRAVEELEPGKCVIETIDGILKESTERLQPAGNIISDTYGFAIGKTGRNNTPIAVCGRVLAFPNEPIESYELGDAVCTGPNGTISKMTREEIREWPDRIVGTVSEIPTYEFWGSDGIRVNNRIWIKVK